MRSSLVREAAAPLPASVRHARTIAPHRPSGLFDDPRRTGAAIAAATIVAVAAIAGLTVMSDRQTGPLHDPADALPATETNAPTAASGTRPPEPVVTTTLRGPRVGLVRVIDENAVAAGSAAPGLEGATRDRAAHATSSPARTAAVSFAATGDMGNARADATPPAVEAGNSAPQLPAAATEDQVALQEQEPEGASPDSSQSDGRSVADAPATHAATPAASVSDPSAATERPETQAPDGLVPATTTTWVNLHDGPDNKARVLVIVPAEASIRAQASCKFWCAVEYRGQSGYIYKDFVKRPVSGTANG